MPQKIPQLAHSTCGKWVILTTVAGINQVVWGMTDKRYSQRSGALSRKASVTEKVSWSNYSPTTFSPL
jgi:hypothetical protein